ncbi:ABC transporter permease [Romboutsia maritimum]|uniref:ABC transporter permease n=1 Tax=Romboutsia maritimum TaxID=2020948 RepID=A0A371ITM4_9FIRM|nr:FtsX-like permease family protein [Romboutsia maritimum]RDY23828.1 ABC transporter permease [Romboutsia maritimum]
MNLFNISLKNVKNSFSNYIMYFVSIIFSVFIFFSFKSIQYNEALSILGDKSRTSINAASSVIALFSFLFIYYSNGFFLNRRKQEIGTYSMLGMRKNQIGKIFLYETFLMGIGAIIIGIILGFLFSKLMTMMLIKIMGVSVIVKMNLSVKALIQTIIVFIAIFIIIGVRNILVIKNKKLIDLFKKQSEKQSKNKFVKIKGVLGIALIVLSYAIANSDFIIKEISFAPVILVTIVPGTFLFFSSAVSLILNLVKNKKSLYYKGRNLIAFSELSYKIKSNSKILATIAILIATSATILGFTISFYYDINRNIQENYKYSFTINAENEAVNKKVDNILNKYYKSNKVKYDKVIELLKRDVNYDIVYKYKKDGFKENREASINIIRESDFKSLRKYKGEEYNDLSSDENIHFVSDEYSRSFIKSIANTKLNIKDDKKTFKVEEDINHLQLNEQSTFDLVVVKDNVFDLLKKKDNLVKLRVIDVSQGKELLKMSLEIEKVVNDNMKFNYPFNFTSQIASYRSLIEMNGLMLFIGVFLSAVFLLCTGSIILFKQLSSIYDDKDRYIMIKKLGANNKDIERMLSKQLKIVFLLPLIVGTMHNLFAMALLQKLMPRSIVVPVIVTLAIYYTGYFMYYFITLKYAKDMVLD